MRIIAICVALAVAGGIGCGGSDKAKQTATETPGDARTQRAQEYEDENNVGMSDERVGRWRWQGDRKQCAYIVGNRCFRTEVAACRFTRCKSECDIDDGRAPARVTCPDKKNNKARK